MTEVTSFYSLTMEDLKSFLKKHGKEQYRAQQLYKWIYEKRVLNFDEMSNLSKDLRQELKNTLNLELPKLKTRLISVDGTQKFLFEMYDEKTVEAVLIPSNDRLTLCISSEVGCNMGCKFCFTGKQKLKRRLSSEEIVGQFLEIEDLIRPNNLKITNIVFMGMGEPLDNCEAVFNSVDILCNDFGRNFSRRKITISTSGIVPEMWRISESKTRLAVSLNGYDNESRNEIMPINKKFPLKELLAECQKYYNKTGDRITFEYVLLKGITDQLDHANKLWNLVKHIPCKINIIPFNEHPGSDYERPSDSQIQKFHSELMDLGAHVLMRRTMGRDIFAACGQLTHEFENKPKLMDISNSNIGGNKNSLKQKLVIEENRSQNV